jgi:hypothetical protein
MEEIRARWTAARFSIGRLHHAVVGLSPKTLANHKANVRSALRWFCKEEDVPSRGLPLTGDWQVPLLGEAFDQCLRIPDTVADQANKAQS